MRSVRSRESAGSAVSTRRSSTSVSSGVTSTATGSAGSGAAVRTSTCAVRYQVPAAARAECISPAGIHSPTDGVMVHVRDPMVALDAPRRFHSSSCVGWECGSHSVSRSTSSSIPVITNGMRASPAAYTGSVRLSTRGRAAVRRVAMG